MHSALSFSENNARNRKKRKKVALYGDKESSHGEFAPPFSPEVSANKRENARAIARLRTIDRVRIPSAESAFIFVSHSCSRAALLYCVNCPHPKCIWCVSRSVQVACVCIYLRKNYLRRVVSKRSANDDNNVDIVVVVTCTLHGCVPQRHVVGAHTYVYTRDISIRNAFRIFV